MPEESSACCDGVTEFVEEEQLMSATWACAKCSTLSNTGSLSLNRREMDLTDGALWGLGIGLVATLRELGSVAQCPSGDQ